MFTGGLAARGLILLFASGFSFGIASVVGCFCLFIQRQEEYGSGLFRFLLYLAIIAGFALLIIALLDI